MGFRTPVRILVAIFLTSLLIPASSSASLGLNYQDRLTVESGNPNVNIISTNEEQNIIAITYENLVEVYDNENKSLIKKFEFNREIYDIEFSPNGKLLAVDVRAISNLENSLHVIDIDNMEILDAKSSGHSHEANIDWSPDGTKILIPSMSSDAKVMNYEDMSVHSILDQYHSAEITCAKYSKSGQYILTGDSNGVLVLWDNDGNYLNVTMDNGEEIVDCGFSQSDVKVGAIYSNGDVRTFTIQGDSLRATNLKELNKMIWSDYDDLIYILKSDSTPEFVVLDGSTLEIISSVKMLHKSVDMELIESSTKIEKLYVATDTNHIAIYQKILPKFGLGQDGPDLDGDGIPNTIDDDDDGDSHIDDWDINCPGENNCHIKADNNTIRQYIIDLEGDKLSIDDIYTMDLFNTYAFRTLAMQSIISDKQISYEEAIMMENAICSNMDSDAYLDRIKNSIELSAGEVNNGTISCIVFGGLTSTEILDSEQIRFGFRTSFDITPNLTLPISIKFNNQIDISDKSITHIVENSPVLVTKMNLNGENEYYFWEKNSDLPPLNFSLNENEKSQVDSIVSDIKENIVVILATSIALLFMIGVIIRKRNLNSAIIYDDDFEEYNEDEIIGDEVKKPEPISNDELSLDEEIPIIESDSLSQEEKPLQRRPFTLDEDEEFSQKPVIKRRVGNIQRNAQGPIMTTKRKRLDGKLDIPGGKIITKKKAVKSRKVRKVKRSEK